MNDERISIDNDEFTNDKVFYTFYEAFVNKIEPQFIPVAGHH